MGRANNRLITDYIKGLTKKKIGYSIDLLLESIPEGKNNWELIAVYVPTLAEAIDIYRRIKKVPNKNTSEYRPNKPDYYVLGIFARNHGIKAAALPGFPYSFPEEAVRVNLKSD